MSEDEGRDEGADLAMCEAATMGPWVVPGYDQAEIAHRHLALGSYPLCNFDLNIGVMGTRQVTPYTMGDVADCNFIAMARTALPFYILALQSERRLRERMEEALKASKEFNGNTAMSLANQICDLCYDKYSDGDWFSDRDLRDDVAKMLAEALDDASKPISQQERQGEGTMR